MTNEDLKRFYQDNPHDEPFDFVRLDGNGKIPASVLPSYVDDVIEGYYHDSKFYKSRTGSGTEQDPYVYSGEIPGETSKIYVDLATNRNYRWGGSTFVLLGGETLPDSAQHLGEFLKVGSTGPMWVNPAFTSVLSISHVEDDFIITYGTSALTYGYITVPISVGTGIIADVAEDGKSIELHLDGGEVVQGVEITDVPGTATSGTLTPEQLLLLQANDANYIMFNHEKYILMDKGHVEGYMGYSHVGVENNVVNIKNITITTSTRGWVLTTKTIS